MSKSLTVHHERDPVSDTRIPDPHQDIFSKRKLGFWMYLMTDSILFTVLFTTYAILHENTFGGPSSQDLFSLKIAFFETMALLFSSVSCGFALLASLRNKKTQSLIWLALTFVLGATFVALELTEFTEFVREGHSWRKSAFLSSFFTLVGTHGLHVSIRPPLDGCDDGAGVCARDHHGHLSQAGPFQPLLALFGPHLDFHFHICLFSGGDMTAHLSLQETQKKWHGSGKTYLIGFISSLLLTLLAFFLVATKMLPPQTLIYTIAGLALVQAFFQLRFFLHVGTEEPPRWEFLVFCCMFLVLLIISLGSLWIMHDLKKRTMSHMEMTHD